MHSRRRSDDDGDGDDDDDEGGDSVDYTAGMNADVPRAGDADGNGDDDDRGRSGFERYPKSDRRRGDEIFESRSMKVCLCSTFMLNVIIGLVLMTSWHQVLHPEWHDVEVTRRLQENMLYNAAKDLEYSQSAIDDTAQKLRENVVSVSATIDETNSEIFKIHQEMLLANELITDSINIASDNHVTKGLTGFGLDRKKWLIIGIPTVPRTSGVDYLATTLDALLSQLPSHPLDPLYHAVHIVVMNNRPQSNPCYTNALSKYRNHPQGHYLTFVTTDFRNGNQDLHGGAEALALLSCLFNRHCILSGVVVQGPQQARAARAPADKVSFARGSLAMPTLI